MQVIDIVTLPFSENAQSLLVMYIREDLGQPLATNWYEGHWTGSFGAYQVPELLFAETQALYKETNSIRGTAGLRRTLLIKEIAKQKKQSTNRLAYMDQPVHQQLAPEAQAPALDIEAPALEVSPLPAHDAESVPPPAPEVAPQARDAEAALPSAAGAAPPQAEKVARVQAEFVLAEPIYPSSDHEVQIVIHSYWQTLIVPPNMISQRGAGSSIAKLTK